MEDREKKQSELDDFWDISELIPKTQRNFGRAASFETEQISLTSRKAEGKQLQSTENTVITRYVTDPSESRLTRKELFDSERSYEPEDSLLHKVTLKHIQCEYRYYEEFLQDAIKYRACQGESCDYKPYFSYKPMYNQLNETQLAYYLWFRESFQKGWEIPIDPSYVLLYVYELINLGDRLDVRQSQRLLAELWKKYHDRFPELSANLAAWICDFSLLHGLPPPVNGSGELAKKVTALKEFYLPMPRGDAEGCAKALLRFCTSYDFRGSKFYTDENKDLFDRHIFGALVQGVRYYSEDGRMLSHSSFQDSKLIRDAYVGAVCTAEQKYRIEVEFCSFSRSNELRFLVGDIVKYSENKLRAYLGIKSKMTVYSIPTEVKELLDTYFEEALLPRRATRTIREKQAYEALYDLPRKPLSLQNAAQIETDSWSTTKELVSAFEEENHIEIQPISEPMPKEESLPKEPQEDDLKSRLQAWKKPLEALLGGDSKAFECFAREQGKMPDVLVEQINELAVELIGDALIEETDGDYGIVEDYRELLE